MEKVVITFNEDSIITVTAIASNTEVISGGEMVVSTADKGKVMLDAAGVDTTKIDEFVSNQTN